MTDQKKSVQQNQTSFNIPNPFSSFIVCITLFCIIYYALYYFSVIGLKWTEVWNI